VTGYNYVIIKDENSYPTYRYCVIKGATPDDELSYEFMIGENKYAFYVDETRTYYSEELQEDVFEITVSGWDVLYPAKRDNFLRYHRGSF
jgi:hypothetical protein